MPVTSEQAMSPRRFFSRRKVYLVRPRFSILICLTLSFGFCLLTVMASSAAQSNRSFEYKDAVEEARLLAQKSFEEPKKLPEFLFKLSYDQWRSIRFKPEEALWRGDKMRFEVQFFHPGFFYNRTVSINVVESGESKSVPFSPDLFHYGMNEFKDKVPQDLGFSGFRLHHPINTGKYYDEVIVFLGASYFRAVGREQNFGLGGRGVAIDTAMEPGESRNHHYLRFAGQSILDRGIPIRHPTGKGDFDRRHHRAVPAKRGQKIWNCAAEQHVFLWREHKHSSGQ
jgi:glucan biosynthesis protein